MTELNNITVTPLEDGMVSLLIDGQPISEKYGMKFEASIVDDIQALDNGQKIKLFDQFVFSHTDLNFEHAYHYVTGIEKGTEDVREFIHAHIHKSLTDYTDLNYAY
ncbi:Uncharacterised protein [Mycobacteroides abscessus subsp. abscessus]|nr:Uncharacterised protein [Mycobacteroides abscessus subsp. abscessus]